MDRDRAEDPHHAEPHARGQQRPEDAVDEAEAGQCQPRAQAHAEPLEAGREARADDQRADQPDRGRVRVARAVGQHEPGQPRAQPRAEREADQRERSRDEPLRPPEQGEQEQEPDDDPVDAGHVRDATGGAISASPLGRSGILDW